MAALTDVGRSRPHNEDANYFDTHLRIALLCDGMGGYSSGEVASAIAIETITEGIRNHASPDRAKSTLPAALRTPRCICANRS
jgi:serine/threonine protein phosphatase PrpC